MASLLEWCQSSKPPCVLLLDGGVSTFLEQELAVRDKVFSHRSLWSSSLLLDGNKTDIQNMHKAFLDAGCDILSSVTYQCHYGVQHTATSAVVSDETMNKMIHDGVTWAKQTVAASSEQKRACFVVASSGSFGGALANGSEYTGNYGDVSLEQLKDFHRRKFVAFQQESPDAVAIETIPNLLECRAVVEMLNEQTDAVTCCWMSLACQNGDLLNDGSMIEEALDIIHGLDPDVRYVHGIGINCCDGIHVPSLLTRIVKHMASNKYQRVICVYPNSGETWDARESAWKEGTGCTAPNEFADRIIDAVRLVQSTWNEVRPADAEALPPKMIVGGCCRTSPATIAAIRQRLDAIESPTTDD